MNLFSIMTPLEIVIFVLVMIVVSVLIGSAYKGIMGEIAWRKWYKAHKSNNRK